VRYQVDAVLPSNALIMMLIIFMLKKRLSRGAAQAVAGTR